MSETSGHQLVFNADTIYLGGVNREGEVAHIKTNPNHDLAIENPLQAPLGLKTNKISSVSDDTLMTYNTSTNRLVYTGIHDFTGATTPGLSGGGGGGTTADISSLNFPGQTLENELDDMTAKTLANTNRTTGLNPLRIIQSNIFGDIVEGQAVGSIPSTQIQNLWQGANGFFYADGLGINRIPGLSTSNTEHALIDPITSQKIQLVGTTNPTIEVGDGTNFFQLVFDTASNLPRLVANSAFQFNNSINLPSGFNYQVNGNPFSSGNLADSVDVVRLSGGGTFTSNIQAPAITATTGYLLNNGSTVSSIANDLVNNNLKFTHTNNIFNFVGDIHINGNQIALADLSDGNSVVSTSSNNTFTGSNIFENNITLQASGATDLTTISNNGIITLQNSTGGAIVMGGKVIREGTNGIDTLAGGINIPAGELYRINNAQISTADLSDGASILTTSATNVFTNTNTFRTDTIFQAGASLDSSIVKVDGSIELTNSSGTKLKLNTREIIDDANGVSIVNGGVNIPSGDFYRINGVAIQSSDLSDGTNLAKLDSANNFTARQDFGQLGIDTDTILFDNSNRSLQRIPPVAPATASQLVFRVLTDEEYKFNINTDEHLRIKASATEPSLFMVDNSSILGASTGFNAVASQAFVNASLQSQNTIDAITDTIENGGGLSYRHDGTTITAQNPANQLRILAEPPTAPGFQLYYRNDRICEFNDNIEFKDNTKSLTNSRVLTQQENITLSTAKEINRTNTYTDLSSTQNNLVVNYLSKIDQLFTDYRRKFNSIELFGDDSTGDPNDGTDDRWTTGTGFMKEYESNGTQFTGSGSPPEYAEISILKYARGLATSDTLHPNKYHAFIHGQETNTDWNILGDSVSGPYICSITFNGQNRSAGHTRYNDYAFIGDTYTINASAIVNVVDNQHGSNDVAPDYIRLPTSGIHHANAHTSTDENSLNNITPSFYLKTGTASPWELVFRFPISGSYIYTSSNINFKKNTNVDVKFKQLDNWEHFTTDFTTTDYP